jgi:hypothetical protein
VFIWYEIVKRAGFFIENIHQTFPILTVAGLNFAQRERAKPWLKELLFFTRGSKP